MATDRPHRAAVAVAAVWQGSAMPAAPPALELAWDQVVGWRLRRHHLDERAPGGDLLAVVAEIAGLHAQIMSSAELGDKLRHSWGSPLKPAASLGLLCFGPSDGQLVRFTRPDQWLPAWHGDQDVVAATRHAEQLMPGPFKDRVYRPQGWLSPVLLARGRMLAPGARPQGPPPPGHHRALRQAPHHRPPPGRARSRTPRHLDRRHPRPRLGRPPGLAEPPCQPCLLRAPSGRRPAHRHVRRLRPRSKGWDISTQPCRALKGESPGVTRRPA